MNTFDLSAHLYDLDQRDVVTADIPFYLNWAFACPGEVLELGCGTGRVTLSLARQGHSVTGLDLSESMLGIFLKKLAAEPAGVRSLVSLVRSDMANFSLDKRFGLIIAPFRAFQALTRGEDAESCLHRVRRHLSDGGRFILDVFRPYAVLDESWCYPETVQWERTDGTTGLRVVKTHRGDRIDTENQIIYPSFTYTVHRPDGTVERITEPLALKYYYPEQLWTLLTACGFEIEERYGWYDGSAVENGRELICVCRLRP